MSHNYLNKNRTQELINTIRGHLSDIATVLSNLASGDARDNTKAPINHNQPSSTITSMTGYTKPQSTSAIAATDTLNEAIGKLEKGLDGAGTPNDGVLTIQQNGTTLGTFSANQAGNTTINVQAISSTMTSSAVNTSDETATIKEDLIDIGIKDTITYTNLSIGATYTLKTRVYDVTTGEYLSITKNNVSSTEILSTITPTNNNGVYVNIFTVDSTENLEVGNTICVNEILEEANMSSVSSLSVVELLTNGLGLRVDFTSNSFTRLGDAVGLNAGSNFSKFPMYKRRRCNLADNGQVKAYYGDSSFKTDGSNGQVMVEQPKFYYKVVPVTLNASDNKQLDVVEYWVHYKPKEGYKLHPAFRDTNGNEIDYFYEGAYEGYINNNKLCSISGVKPSSGSSGYTRANFRTAAAARGNGWRQETIWNLSADQILMIIEYQHFNMQARLGKGNVGGSTASDIQNTGNTTGNYSTGRTDISTAAVSWRGKENPWGNVNVWTDGINFHGLIPYIANSYSFADDTSINYTQLGFNLAADSNYIGRFGYDANFDWIFIPYGSIVGNSALPVGDMVYQNLSQWNTGRSGGMVNSSDGAGAFYFSGGAASTKSAAGFGARLLYVG